MEIRDIKYLNKDFTTLNNQLIEFAKTYYPNTYTDFTPSSPGMMFYGDGFICWRCSFILLR